MWGIVTGRSLKTFPLRKWLALHVTVWSFLLVGMAMMTGRDIPPNASGFLTVLAPAVFGLYAAGSSYEAVKGKGESGE